MNLDKFFNPKTVALVGASENIVSWGFIVLHNILVNGYDGTIYPINPKSKEIMGKKVYPSILDIPQDEKIDLVVVIIRSDLVMSILEQCVIRDVHHVVVISAGFREAGKQGAELEDELVDYARKNDISLIGPNGMGIVSTRVNLVSVMWPVEGLRKGGLTLLSQSGNIGTIGISVAAKRGIGLNAYVSAGNMAHLKIEDYLEYFGLYDDQTRVIGIYIEGTPNGRRLISLIKEISKIKPIIILKAGGSKHGKRAAMSHTGAITGDDIVFKQIAKSSGAIVIDTLEEMFDLVVAFENWLDYNLIKGKVVVLTLGGGWGVLAADACSNLGISLIPLNETSLSKIDELLPPFWSRGNPIDTVASLDLKALYKIIKIIFEDLPETEAILLLGIGGYSFLAEYAKGSNLIKKESKELLSVVSNSETELMKKLLEVSQTNKKPILITSLLTRENSLSIRYLSSVNYPIFSSPLNMVRCLRHMVDYNRWKRRI